MIKARPEDFLVDEKAALPAAEKGDFRVYRLAKTGWTTVDLIRRLARELGVSPAAISYGGKKDKHGFTAQFIAIRDARDFSREGAGYSLRAAGFMDRPMGPDLIASNAFRVTVRGLAAAGDVRARLEEARRWGFPNYFDDQRFRSYDPERGFFAEKILLRQWNGALQVFLTSISPDMSSAEKARRRAIFEHWKDWPSCRERAKGRLETSVFGYLESRPREFARALHKLPPDEISMRYSSYQSHLWNELLRRVLRGRIPDLVSCRGIEGDYLYWRSLDENLAGELLPMSLPTAAARMPFSDDAARDLFAAVLRERGLKFGDFRTRVLQKAYFKSFPRQAVVVPEALEMVEAGADELHPGRSKVALAFTLPRGSYATMLVKFLFRLTP